MLRFELELENDSCSRFMDMLSAFLNDFSGPVTSCDFVRVAGAYLGGRTDQFFNQWLYDWRVPEIKKQFEYTDEGGVLISLMVNDVGDDFETPYPVRFIMSDNSMETEIYYIVKGSNVFEFRPSPGLELKSVDFNPDYDILER
jgi:aminopeptidase N